MLHFFVGQVVHFYKGCQVGVKGRERLGSCPFILHNPQEVYHLVAQGGQVAGRGRSNLAGDAAQAFLDQLFQAPAGAVAGEHGQVVDVHGSALVGIRHFLVINFVEPIVGCNGTGVGQDQTAYRIGHSGIFLYPPVVDFQVVVHQVLVVQQSGVHVANLFSLFPVQDIRLGHISIARIGQDFFHAVLDAFHTNQVVFDLRVKVSCHLQSHHIDNTGMIVLMQCLKGLCNCLTDFGNFEVYDFAIPFYHRIHG